MITKPLQRLTSTVGATIADFQRWVTLAASTLNPAVDKLNNLPPVVVTVMLNESTSSAMPFPIGGFAFDTTTFPSVVRISATGFVQTPGITLTLVMFDATHNIMVGKMQFTSTNFVNIVSAPLILPAGYVSYLFAIFVDTPGQTGNVFNAQLLFAES